MKSYKTPIIVFIVSLAFFIVTILWQDSLGIESKTTDYFWIIFGIQLTSLTTMFLSICKIIIIKLKEISKR